MPLGLNLPATPAAGVAPAVPIAAAINLLVAILPVMLAVWTLSPGTGFMARSEKIGAILLDGALGRGRAPGGENAGTGWVPVAPVGDLPE